MYSYVLVPAIDRSLVGKRFLYVNEDHSYELGKIVSYYPPASRQGCKGYTVEVSFNMERGFRDTNFNRNTYNNTAMCTADLLWCIKISFFSQV